MANDASTTNQNGQPSDELIQRALAVLAATEAKQAEKDAKAAARKAEKLAKGPTPNASHAFLIEVVAAVNAASVAFDGDDSAFRTYVMTLLGFIDTAAQGDNVTTARDFEVIGSLIRTTRPTVPVS